jgi:hypothetical protein
MFSGKQGAKFIQVHVRIFSVDHVNGSMNSAIDDALGPEELRHWSSNTAMLSKDLAPAVETPTAKIDQVYIH